MASPGDPDRDALDQGAARTPVDEHDGIDLASRLEQQIPVEREQKARARRRHRGRVGGRRRAELRLATILLEGRQDAAQRLGRVAVHLNEHGLHPDLAGEMGKEDDEPDDAGEAEQERDRDRELRDERDDGVALVADGSAAPRARS